MKTTRFFLAAIIGICFLIFPSSGDFLLAIEPLSLFAAGAGLASGLSGIGSGRRAVRNADKIANRIMGRANMTIDEDLGRFAGDLESFSGYEEMFKTLASQYGDEAAKAYLDTTEGKAFMREMSTQSKKNRKEWMNANNLSGGTTESLLAGYGAINESEARGLTGLSANANRRRQSLRNAQLASLSGALGANTSRVNLKRNIIDNARGYASSIYGQSFNAAGNQVAGQVGSMSSGFGQLATGLIGLELLGGEQKAA